MDYNLIQIDYDPFSIRPKKPEEQAYPGFNLEPVDYDPFEDTLPTLSVEAPAFTGRLKQSWETGKLQTELGPLRALQLLATNRPNSYSA